MSVQLGIELVLNWGGLPIALDTSWWDEFRHVSFELGSLVALK
jgi:hypothetical protein